jgi:hypothetical protein
MVRRCVAVVSLALLVVTIAADSADARRRHRYHSDREWAPRAAPAGPARSRAPLPTPRVQNRQPVEPLGPSLWSYRFEGMAQEIIGDPRAAAERKERPGATFSLVCDYYAQHLARWPVQKLREVVRPSPAQSAKLEELQRTTKQEGDNAVVACPKALPPNPIERAQVLRAGAVAMRKSLNGARSHFEQLYLSLSEEQKARVLSLTIRAEYEGGASPTRKVCEPLSRPVLVQGEIDRIATASSVNQEQTRALYEISTALLRGIVLVQDSCPVEMSLTPMGQLEALEKRAQAFAEALSGMEQPLAAFYGSLGDEQKARLGYTAPPAPAVSAEVGAARR